MGNPRTTVDTFVDSGDPLPVKAVVADSYWILRVGSHTFYVDGFDELRELIASVAMVQIEDFRENLAQVATIGDDDVA